LFAVAALIAIGATPPAAAAGWLEKGIYLIGRRWCLAAL
jgi:hypothetical protein